MLDDGHTVVSAVAKPVVVVIEQTWKAASRRDSGSGMWQVRLRSRVTRSVAAARKEKKDIVAVDILRRPELLLMARVERNTKLTPEVAMKKRMIISTETLPYDAMLALRTQNPHVLHVDMASVTASNHPRPASLRESAHASVRIIYTVSMVLTQDLPCFEDWERVMSEISALERTDLVSMLRGIIREKKETIPRPPTHEVETLQKRSPAGIPSLRRGVTGIDDSAGPPRLDHEGRTASV